MAQHILGLDLGASAVKAVLLESTYRGFAVLDAARAPLAPVSPDDATPLLARQASALQALLAERGWRVDTAVAAFPGAGLSSNVVTLPFVDAKRIGETVGFEVEGQIPFELADVAWDWQPLGAPRDGKTDLLVGVVRKEELGQLLAALAPAGVDPRVVVPAGAAYASLLALGAAGAPPPPDDGAPSAAAADVIADVGQDRTNLCVATDAGCEAARTFAFGASHLARAVARELGLDEAEGAAIVSALAGGPELPTLLAEQARDPRTADALRRALAPLARELRATLRAWRTRVGARRVGRLLLAGEGGRLAAVSELLAAEVEGPVSTLALSGPAAAGIPEAGAPGLALALALALRGHQGSRAPRLNLRRGDLAFTRDFEHVKGKVARLAAYAALIVVLGLASAGVKVFALSRQEAALDRALCDAEQKILGKCYPNFEEAQSIFRGRGTPGATLPKVSAVDVFAELSERVPAEVPLRFDRVDVTRDKLHLEGTTDTAESVDRIVSALKASRCFSDARSGSARKRASDGKFEFSIESGLTCLDTGARDVSAGGRG